MYKNIYNSFVIISILLGSLVISTASADDYFLDDELFDLHESLHQCKEASEFYPYFDYNISLIHVACDGLSKDNLDLVKKYTLLRIRIEAMSFLAFKMDPLGKKFHDFQYGFKETLDILKKKKIQPTAVQIAFMQDYLFGPIKKGYDPEGISEEEELKLVPLRVRFGITISLCGFFLYIMPDPKLKQSGKVLLGFGSGLVAEGMISKLEKDEEKKRS